LFGTLKVQSLILKIGSNYISSCSRVGVGGETGSGEDGSGDCVMHTSERGAGGGGSGIVHTRGAGNSSYSGGEGVTRLPLLLFFFSVFCRHTAPITSGTFTGGAQ